MHYTIDSPPKRLREGDTVEFAINGTTLAYTCGKTRKSGLVYLKQEGTARNRQIFDLLDIQDQEVSEFAAQAFGYAPTGDKWPRSKASDFAAQVRLVYKVYGAIATAPEPAPAIALAPAGDPALIQAFAVLFRAITGQDMKV